MGFFKKLVKIHDPLNLRSMFKKKDYGNPSESAMGYLNQIPGAVQPYYQPFIESGQQASGMVNPIYEQMSQNPGAFIENLMRGYTPSRGYQFKQGEMERAMRNAASHGGFVGTPYNQQQQAELVQNMLGTDMQEFLQNLLGAQETGLQGQEGRIKRGYEASTGYGDLLGQNIGTQAGLSYVGNLQRMKMDQARRQARSGFLSQILGMGGQALGTMYGGPMGGAMGGMAGSTLGQGLGGGFK